MCGSGRMASEPKRLGWSRTIRACASLHARARSDVASGVPMSMPGADTETMLASIPAMSMNSSDCCVVQGSTWPAEPGDAARSTPIASR